MQLHEGVYLAERHDVFVLVLVLRFEGCANRLHLGRFMPADSLWTLCMAFNVYLTFFKGRNATDLRRLEKWYFLFCYGFPLPPPIIYLVLDYTKNRHGPRIYGPATASVYRNAQQVHSLEVLITMIAMVLGLHQMGLDAPDLFLRPCLVGLPGAQVCT